MIKTGYELERKVTISRSKHRVYINNKTTVSELIKELENAPDDATFEEFEWFSDESHYIEFHHEKLVTE